MRLSQPVHARSMEVFENFSPGSLRSVAARLDDDALVPLWAGATAPGELSPVLGSNFSPTQVVPSPENRGAREYGASRPLMVMVLLGLW